MLTRTYVRSLSLNNEINRLLLPLEEKQATEMISKHSCTELQTTLRKRRYNNARPRLFAKWSRGIETKGWSTGAYKSTATTLHKRRRRRRRIRTTLCWRKNNHNIQLDTNSVTNLRNVTLAHDQTQLLARGLRQTGTKIRVDIRSSPNACVD